MAAAAGSAGGATTDAGDKTIDGLTAWDLARPVRQVVTDDTEREVMIDVHLQCPVCLDVMSKTFVMLKCLHRFCQQCMQTSLRIQKNECPACRAHCPSHRSSRPDKTFDELITAVVADVEEDREKRAEAIAQSNLKLNFNNAFTASARLVSEQQKSVRARTRAIARRGSKRKDVPVSNEPREVPELVGFVLRPLPTAADLRELPRRYIRGPSKMRVAHIKKYLDVKLETGDADSFTLSLSHERNAQPLDDTLSLRDLYQRFDGPMHHLTLHYAINDTAL